MSGVVFTLASNSAIIFIMGAMAQVFSTVTGNSSLGSRMRLKSFGVPSLNGGVNQLF